MNTLSALWAFWSANGTRILGTLQGVIAVLCGANVIPDNHMKWWLAASAVLTYLRGQANANTLSNTLPPPQSQAKVR
jgi:hypothetical protein